MKQVNLIMLCAVAIALLTEVKSECAIVTDDGDCCVIPFTYKGKIYEFCTFKDAKIPWCSLTADYDKDKMYGVCEFKTCQIKTTNGECCVFPFTYGGVSYDACTIRWDKNAWCGTKSSVDYLTVEPRGYCRLYAEPCFKNPCKNSGVCQSDKSQFYCNCTKGYKGKTCSEKVLPCESSPCKNGGQCENDGEEFKCNCLEGYKGDDCGIEAVHPCESSPCKNGGQCENDGEEYKCNCLEGYNGDDCGIKAGTLVSSILDPCNTSPCQNGAKCFSDTAKEEIYCKCPKGFKGETCAEKVDPCKLSPCENGGTCVNKSDNFQCKCAKNFQGDTCRFRVDLCSRTRCENGGKCLSDMQNFVFHCQCSEGFEGEKCGVRIEPCNSFPCENGGKCVNTGNTFRCECAEPYEGDTCQSKANGSCKNANWWRSFDSTGWSRCPSTSPYINGLYRSKTSLPSSDSIQLLEEAKCCEGYKNLKSECLVVDWTISFDKDKTWNLCTDGYYLSGLYRSSGNNLHNIEKAWCCKPRGAPNSCTSCYNENVRTKFDYNKKGMVSCLKPGHYITGLY
ncbi:fibropellin-1-like [Dendronephthya gigantea]|uniref:fibropellin-1-like n=1 Tax=Dendronephthya gigantea TaxID=151771 RepID=UPI00106DBB92|nr:fibropellin-1-like [Dendronephthya gigantea]XP_028400043.1 fibropellin-1-like [Dendronephthya gigantea]